MCEHKSSTVLLSISAALPSVEIGLVENDELIDSFHDIDFFHLFFELVPAEIWQGYQQMHQDAYFHGFSNEFQDAIHKMDSLLRLIG